MSKFDLMSGNDIHVVNECDRVITASEFLFKMRAAKDDTLIKFGGSSYMDYNVELVCNIINDKAAEMIFSIKKRDPNRAQIKGVCYGDIVKFVDNVGDLPIVVNDRKGNDRAVTDIQHYFDGNSIMVYLKD